MVLVDELDRGWDSSEDARAFVSGLFQACVSMNEVHPNLRVYVSLRQELYDDIPALYEDAQKYRDLLETISWSEDSLLKLIARRITHCAREAGDYPPALEQATDSACWNAVFAIPPGHPVNSSFRYMVERTLHRPRELIQFCAETLEAARERAVTLPLPYAAIGWTERAYSASGPGTSPPSTGSSTRACWACSTRSAAGPAGSAGTTWSCSAWNWPPATSPPGAPRPGWPTGTRPTSSRSCGRSGS